MTIVQHLRASSEEMPTKAFACECFVKPQQTVMLLTRTSQNSPVRRASAHRVTSTPQATDPLASIVVQDMKPMDRIAVHVLHAVLAHTKQKLVMDLVMLATPTVQLPTLPICGTREINAYATLDIISLLTLTPSTEKLAPNAREVSTKTRCQTILAHLAQGVRQLPTPDRLPVMIVFSSIGVTRRCLHICQLVMLMPT
jgi:hypothetical protein